MAGLERKEKEWIYSFFLDEAYNHIDPRIYCDDINTSVTGYINDEYDIKVHLEDEEGHFTERAEAKQTRDGSVSLYIPGIRDYYTPSRDFGYKCRSKIHDYFREFLWNFFESKGFFNEDILNLVESYYEGQLTPEKETMIKNILDEAKEEWEDYFDNSITRDFAEEWLDEYIRGDGNVELRRKSSIRRATVEKIESRPTPKRIIKPCDCE